MNKNYFLNKKFLRNFTITVLIIYLVNKYNIDKEDINKKYIDKEDSQNYKKNNEFSINYSFSKQFKKNKELAEIDFIDPILFNKIFFEDINKEDFKIKYYYLKLNTIEDSKEIEIIKNNFINLILFLNSNECFLTQDQKKNIIKYINLLFSSLKLDKNAAL